MSGKSRMVFALLAIIIIGHFIYSRLYDSTVEITHGATELKHKAFTEDLNITGPTTFTNIKVEANTKIVGPVTGSQGGKFKALEIEGPAEMDTVTATQFTITGPLNCTKCTFDSATVTGPATLTDSTLTTLSVTGPLGADSLTVNDSAKVFGPVNAKNSTFDKLEINTTEATFEDTKITNLLIVADESKRKQVIELNGSTTIVNDITFQSGTGEVIINSESVKIKGVIGGTQKLKFDAGTPTAPVAAPDASIPAATPAVTPTPATPVPTTPEPAAAAPTTAPTDTAPAPTVAPAAPAEAKAN